MRFVPIVAVAAAALSAASADATVYHFDFVGPSPSSAFQFDLDSSPTPDKVVNEVYFEVNNVLTTSNDSIAGPQSGYANYIFFLKTVRDDDGSHESRGGFSYGNPDGMFYGPQLFKGSLNNPTFKLGTFFFNSDTSYLTISSPAGAVPELAQWAMMVAGFGAIGTVMRRRRCGARVPDNGFCS